MPQHLRSAFFTNYKSLSSYRIHFREFNTLVGPNNSGKSTILNGFRILSEGLRQAKSRSPSFAYIDGRETLCWPIPTKNIPVATENIFTDYDDSEPARIQFSLNDGSTLSIIFSEPDRCHLLVDSHLNNISRPKDFKKAVGIRLGFSPILGPVEADERLYQESAARHALTTAQHARNFRNIWYHYPDRFPRFRELVQRTWPEMDIELPEIQRGEDAAYLRMFCTERRVAREIHWAGFGFQVWCQMLTYIVHSESDTMLVIDEPDIYLHPDLQRQLVTLLHEIEPAILIATHSTEILTECDPTDILVIDNRRRQAKRLKQPNDLTPIFGALGSSLNPAMTQLAKTQRAVFVEGDDFRVLARLAERSGYTRVALGTDFATIPTGGFNVQKTQDFVSGIEATLGLRTRNTVIFDRDFRHPDSARSVRDAFADKVDYFHMHTRKEIENYLLIPDTLDRALNRALYAREKRQGTTQPEPELSKEVLRKLTDKLKIEIQSHIVTSYTEYYRNETPHLAQATAHQRALRDFEDAWSSLEGRLTIAPGKRVLSMFNRELEVTYGINLTPRQIVDAMQKSEIPEDLHNLFMQLDRFRELPPPD